MNAAFTCMSELLPRTAKQEDWFVVLLTERAQ
jgi:hypothetical protein